jgi:ribA/ribD-fused uncharacterized protein
MVIDCFDGEYRFLSNFYPASVYGYPSVEHAYQASKFPKEERAFIKTLTAGQAKRYGRTVKLPPDWETRKLEIMRTLLRRKFSPIYHWELCYALMKTNPATLIEGNTWGDRFWGVCNGEGENQLGLALMEIRAEVIAVTR